MLESIEYFIEADRLFYAELERRVLEEEKIYIITTSKSFTLVGKLLCSLTDDKLVLKEQMLVPSKCEHYTKDSYLSVVKHSSINVIQTLESQNLPSLLLELNDPGQKLQVFEKSIKEVIELFKPLSKQFDVELSYSQCVEGWIEVEASPNTYGSVEKFMSIAQQRYPASVILCDDLVQHIIDKLLQHNKKITLAESCTGGLLAYYFTAHPGVSAVFEGSLVTYSNILKENWIAVENSTLVEHGAVSEPVVSEMCAGALTIAQADYALAISGVAGPDGGTETKPVGTVVIGTKSSHYEKVLTHHFNGDRNYIQQQSAMSALKMLVLGDKKVFFTK